MESFPLGLECSFCTHVLLFDGLMENREKIVMACGYCGSKYELTNPFYVNWEANGGAEVRDKVHVIHDWDDENQGWKKVFHVDRNVKPPVPAEFVDVSFGRGDEDEKKSL